MAVIKRLTDLPVGSAAAWGQPLDEQALSQAMSVVSEVVSQDRSLTRHVARDTTLFFESFGGIAVNEREALLAVGYSPSSDVGGSADRASQMGAQALAVARTIQSRYQGREGQPADVAAYRRLFEDTTDEGHEGAVNIAAWSGTVTARLRTSGYIDGDVPVFGPPAAFVAPMTSIGWYPNPVNAGDTSRGDASVERWWDGSDWTNQVRVRDGRRWSETSLSLLKTPSN